MRSVTYLRSYKELITTGAISHLKFRKVLSLLWDDSDVTVANRTNLERDLLNACTSSLYCCNVVCGHNVLFSWRNYILTIQVSPVCTEIQSYRLLQMCVRVCVYVTHGLKTLRLSLPSYWARGQHEIEGFSSLQFFNSPGVREFIISWKKSCNQILMPFALYDTE